MDDSLIDIHVTTWPLSALKVEPLSDEKEKLHWEFYRRCWHNLKPGECDNPDCIVRFVMFS